MAVIFNAKGTTSPYFLLGKGGTTLFQGSSDPTGSYSAAAGDVWFDTNANTLKFRNSGNSAWEQGSLAGGDLDVTGDATISGNLTVSGTTTIVSTTNVSIQDPLLLLARNVTGTPSQDAGFIVERGDSTNVGMIWDESATRFAVVNTTEAGTTAGDISIASYANLQIAGLTATSADITTITGTFQGTAVADAYVADALTISGGTVNGSVIGGSTPAAITGTTITATGSLVGTLTTAAQTNVTSVGSLGSLTVGGAITVAGIVGTAATGALTIPSGTTAQRPGTPAIGMIRYNSTVSRFEGYDGSNWLYIDIPADLGDA